MQNYREIKIRIISPKHNEKVQKILFSTGAKWSISGTIVLHQYAKFLYVYANGELSFGDTESHFISKPFKEIFIPYKIKTLKE